MEIIIAFIGAVATVVAAFIPVLFKKNSDTNKKLERLFSLTMSGTMYENLLKLEEKRFYTYQKDNGLERELIHLRDIGYIEITEKSNSRISDIPYEGENLHEYVRVTNVGEEFVELRKSYNVK